MSRFNLLAFGLEVYQPRGDAAPHWGTVVSIFKEITVRIAIHRMQHLLLMDVLSQHRDGQSRLLWKTNDYKLPAKYRTVAAAPMLNQLHVEPKFLCINGDQRDLLLRLLAWAAIANRKQDELVAAKDLLAKLQPQGAPIQADIGDFAVIKQSGVLVEIVHFDGADEENLVSSASKGFIVCEVYANPEDGDLQFIDRSLDDLMWPEWMSADVVIWGPSPNQLAA